MIARSIVLPMLGLVMTISMATAQPPGRLGLNEAVDEALRNNPTLKQRRAALAAIRAERLEDTLPPDPEVFLEYEGISTGDGPSGFGERKYGVSQTFEFPLSYWRRARLNSLEAARTSHTFDRARQNVRAEVARAFHRVILFDEQVGIHRELADLAEDIVRTASVRVDAGDAAPYESLRARVNLADTMNRLRAAEADRQAALYGLKQLLGRARDDSLAIGGDLAFTPVNLDVDALKRIAMSEHPSLRRALTTVEEHESARKLAWFGLVPDITVSAFRQDIREGGDTSSWGAEIGMHFPLWGLVTDRGRIRAAEHRLQASGWELEAQKRTVLAGIEQAAARLLKAQDQIASYRDTMLHEADEMVRITRRGYEEGEMSYRDLAEALMILQRTRLGYTETLHTAIEAMIDLELAVGRPLDTPNE